MAGASFTDSYLASLYDRLSVNRGDEEFYLHLMMSENAVLDVGCGTGTLLHRARQAGHPGRLCGLDPAEEMLALARRYEDIEWRPGTLPDAGFAGEFDLVVMTGHAFQVLQTDADILGFLTGARRALTPSGRLAFETRNPLARAWEGWAAAPPSEVVDDAGATVRVWHEIEDVDDEYVTFTESYAADSWDAPIVTRDTLRFVPAEHLDALLVHAGLAIHERYGFWDRSPFTPHSPEIITVAAAS